MSSFSEHGSFTSSAMFIPGYFILFNELVNLIVLSNNQIVNLIVSLSDNSLLREMQQIGLFSFVSWTFTEFMNEY